MWKIIIRPAFAMLTMFIFSSCATTEHTPAVESRQQKLLRVGVTLNYPPVIFKQGGKIAGVEADLARLLAAKLGKSVKFVELRWDDQIPSLMEGRTDIIMSGMSITRARSVRIKFTDHYLKSGLVAMMRIEDSQTYNSIENVIQSSSNVGVVAGTTSDVFVRKNFPNVFDIIALQEADDAPAALDRRSIDIFVHDAPSIIWLVSENESDISGLWEPLNEEYLAWGVRRGNEELFMKVNTILSDWKKDGTLHKTLLNWIPSQYFDRIK